MMSKQITDEQLRIMLHSFDEIDIDLDNMVIDKEIVFSDEHNEKMRKYFEKLRTEEKINRKIISFKNRYKNYKLVASIVMVVFLGTALFNIDTVFAYADRIKAFVISEFEKYSLVSVENDVNTQKEIPLNEFELVYESNNFKLVDTKILPLYKIYKYTNSNGNYIKITVSNQTDDKILDTENTNIIKKEIQGISYNMVKKDNNIEIYYLKNGLLYNVKTDISEDDIFKEIENIK